MWKKNGNVKSVFKCKEIVALRFYCVHFMYLVCTYHFMRTRVKAWAGIYESVSMSRNGRVCWFYDIMFAWFDSHLSHIPTHNVAAMERTKKKVYKIIRATKTLSEHKMYGEWYALSLHILALYTNTTQQHTMLMRGENFNKFSRVYYSESIECKNTPCLA